MELTQRGSYYAALELPIRGVNPLSETKRVSEVIIGEAV